MRLGKVELSRRTVVVGGAALVVAGVGVAAGVASCTRGAADVPVEPTASGDDAEGASKLGGKLVLYSSCSQSLINAAVARFSQDTGVTVSVVRGTEAELAARMADDAANGEPAADIVWGGDPAWLSVGMEKPVKAEREVAALAVSPELKDAPETYSDLLETDLAGRVALCDPATCEAGWLHLVGALAAAGGTAAGGALGSDVAWQFVTDLLAVGAVVCASEDEALQMVLDGGVDVALVSEQQARHQARRTGEMGVAWPGGGLATATGCAAKVSGCRNASQADAFLDFLSGHDGQQVLTDALARPVADGVSASGEDGMPSDDDLEADGIAVPTDAEQRASLLATWESVRAGTWAPAEATDAEAETAEAGL